MKCKSNMFCAILLFMGYFLFAVSDLTAAEQCYVVRIAKESDQGGVDRIYLHPQELKVSKGSCVIWVNWVTEEKVMLSFSEKSKTCKISTEFASGFVMKNECVLTNYLSYGKTVSLHFNEKGVFTYQLELVDGDSKYEGKIERKGQIIVE